MEFDWEWNKYTASSKTMCKTFRLSLVSLSSSAKVSKVMVSVQNNPEDSVGWAAKSVMIPSYVGVGSLSYMPYSMAPPEPRFWVSSNAKCEELGTSLNLFPCCPNGEWCRLYSKGMYHWCPRRFRLK